MDASPFAGSGWSQGGIFRFEWSSAVVPLASVSIESILPQAESICFITTDMPESLKIVSCLFRNKKQTPFVKIIFAARKKRRPPWPTPLPWEFR
jgi:hypothetical protein